MEHLTLEQAYYVGELIGVLALIGSLVYVGIGVRQNARATRLSSLHDISSLYASVMMCVAQDTETSTLWVRGLQEYGHLNPGERARFIMLMGVSVRTMSQQFFQWRQGALDTENWNGMKAVIDDITLYPGFAEYWRLRSHQYSDAFQTYVNDALELAPTAAHRMYS